MLMYKIKLSYRAKKDIKSICDFLYNGDKIIKKINQDIKSLETMPRAYKTLKYNKDPDREYRRIVSRNYIIMYKSE